MAGRDEVLPSEQAPEGHDISVGAHSGIYMHQTMAPSVQTRRLQGTSHFGVYP